MTGSQKRKRSETRVASRAPKRRKHGRFPSAVRETMKAVARGEMEKPQRFCRVPDCYRVATHRKPGESRTRCGTHKEDGMVNPCNKCVEPGCYKRRLFAAPGTNKEQRCKEHKREGDVRVYKSLCAVPGCTKQKCYGMKGKVARFCREHATPCMVNVRDRICQIEGCTTTVRTAADHCARHRQTENAVAEAAL